MIWCNFADKAALLPAGIARCFANNQTTEMSILKYSDVEILRKELVVLKHVSFSLEEGEFAYLIGRVGSGKSSLMKSIYAEIPIFNGHAEVMGTQLTGIKRKEIPLLRRNIGIVFQDFQLLTDRTVYDNLKFVLDATGWHDRIEIDDRIEQVLKQVGMHNKLSLIHI